MSKDNGGPAFPSAPMTETELSYGRDMGRSTTQVCSYDGMSMRDYFAAKAMGACIGGMLGWGPCVLEDALDEEAAAQFAYKCADAMVEERRK